MKYLILKQQFLPINKLLRGSIEVGGLFRTRFFQLLLKDSQRLLHNVLFIATLGSNLEFQLCLNSCRFLTCKLDNEVLFCSEVKNDQEEIP